MGYIDNRLKEIRTEYEETKKTHEDLLKKVQQVRDKLIYLEGAYSELTNYYAKSNDEESTTVDNEVSKDVNN